MLMRVWHKQWDQSGPVGSALKLSPPPPARPPTHSNPGSLTLSALSVPLALTNTMRTCPELLHHPVLDYTRASGWYRQHSTHSERILRDFPFTFKTKNEFFLLTGFDPTCAKQRAAAKVSEPAGSEERCVRHVLHVWDYCTRLISYNAFGVLLN